MPKIYLIGKVDDFSLLVDFHRSRAIVRANTAKVEGIKLENLPPGRNEMFPAMVLINRDWRKQYFVIEREGWNEEDYFRHAERLFQKQGITEP